MKAKCEYLEYERKIGGKTYVVNCKKDAEYTCNICGLRFCLKCNVKHKAVDNRWGNTRLPKLN